MFIRIDTMFDTDTLDCVKHSDKCGQVMGNVSKFVYNI